MTNSFTAGPIPRQLATFSFPILLTNLLQASMQVINSLWVGNLLGSEGFAAVTIGTTIMSLVLAFVFGINNATLTIFAQLKASGDRRQINDYLSAFTLILIALSLLISMTGFLFTERLLLVMNAPASVMEEASAYLKINFAGTILLVGYNFIGTALRAFGDSKTPLYFVLLATVLVAALNPFLISGMGLGIAGSAWAIVLAQSIAFLSSLVYLSRRFKGHSFTLRVPTTGQIKTILELGIPSGLQLIVIYAGMTVILALVNSLGGSAVAGFGAAQRLDNIIILPAIALSTAVNTMAAQNIGQQKWDRVSLIARVGLVYNVGIMLAIATVLFLWAEPLIRLFVQEPESVAFGTTYLRTIAFFYPFLGLNFILNGVVRGSGAMFRVLVLNIISLWVLRVPLTYGATALFGDAGVALGIGCSLFLSALFSVAYYRWGGWKNKRLFS